MITKLTRFFWIPTFLLFISLLSANPVSADTGTVSSSPRLIRKSSVLCLPGILSTDSQDCLSAGPAEYLTEQAQQGITFPLEPLEAARPDPQLAYPPFQYARLIDNQSTPVYATQEDALAGVNPVRTIDPGKLRYVSYIQEVYPLGRAKPDAFQLASGEWVSASNVSRRERAISTFQGFLFTHNPPRPFGWILPLNPSIETKRTPGYDKKDDYTGHILYEYDVVQIYSTRKVGDIDWYLVGPDEWAEQRLIGMVSVETTPPEGVTNGRWIDVNLFEQTLTVYDQGKLVFATLIASGLQPFYTRPGVFQIYQKYKATTMRGAFEADRSDFYYLESVPWTMYYDEARALHGAYWRTRYGFPQSHGCVNISPGDAHWLFDWAKEGDWVHVWDPSGKTPTDPKFYTDGGA